MGETYVDLEVIHYLEVGLCSNMLGTKLSWQQLCGFPWRRQRNKIYILNQINLDNKSLVSIGIGDEKKYSCYTPSILSNEK